MSAHWPQQPDAPEPFQTVDPRRARLLVELIGRISAGDRRAEEELFAGTRFALWMILRRRGCEEEEADEVVQETFLIALGRLRSGRVEQPERFDGFLYRTALNVQRGRLRSEQRRQARDEGAPHPDWLDESGDPLANFDAEQQRVLLDQVLERLPQARDRELLRRRYLQEEEKAVTCAALELPPVHYDKVLFRAHQRLRKLLARWLE